MTMVLHLKVVYSLNGVNPAVLKNVLLNAAQHVVDNGLLSGETEAEVITCDSEVISLPAKDYK